MSTNAYKCRLVYKARTLSSITGINHKIECDGNIYMLDMNTDYQWRKKGSYKEMDRYMDGLIMGAVSFSSGLFFLSEDKLEMLAIKNICDKYEVSGFHEFILTRKGSCCTWGNLIKEEINNLKIGSYDKRYKMYNTSSGW